MNAPKKLQKRRNTKERKINRGNSKILLFSNHSNEISILFIHHCCQLSQFEQTFRTETPSTTLELNVVAKETNKWQRTKMIIVIIIIIITLQTSSDQVGQMIAQLLIVKLCIKLTLKVVNGSQL